MKSNLDKKQLKKMYGSKRRKSTPTKTSESNKISTTTARDAVIIEDHGTKHALPTHAAYTELLKEHNMVKTDLRRVLTEVRILREAVTRLMKTSTQLENDLKNKIDKLD